MLRTVTDYFPVTLRRSFLSFIKEPHNLPFESFCCHDSLVPQRGTILS